MSEKAKLFLNAVRNKNLPLVYRLIDEGVDVNSRSKDNGKQAIHIAVEKGHDKIVKILLNTGFVSVDTADDSKETILHYAINAMRLSIVELLVARHCNCNIQNKIGSTPLHWIFAEFSRCCCRAKNDCGKIDKAEITSITFHLDTMPKTVTRKCIWLATAAFLIIKSNADISVVNRYGKTPLDIIPSDYFEHEAVTTYFKKLLRNCLLSDKLTNTHMSTSNEGVCFWRTEKSDGRKTIEDSKVNVQSSTNQCDYESLQTHSVMNKPHVDELNTKMFKQLQSTLLQILNSSKENNRIIKRTEERLCAKIEKNAFDIQQLNVKVDALHSLLVDNKQTLHSMQSHFENQNTRKREMDNESSVDAQNLNAKISELHSKLVEKDNVLESLQARIKYLELQSFCGDCAQRQITYKLLCGHQLCEECYEKHGCERNND